MILLIDPEFMHAKDMDGTSICTLQAGIPLTHLIEGKDTELWWKERKACFFKPEPAMAAISATNCPTRIWGDCAGWLCSAT